MRAAAGWRERTFGEYVLRRKLGAGGMSEVWRAEKVGPGGAVKPCAIKIILPHYKDSEKRVQRFLDEVRLSAQLSHANLVEVLNFGVHDGQYYLVLELIRGMDLGSWVEALAEDASRRPRPPTPPDRPDWEREMDAWESLLQKGVLPPVLVAWIGMKACTALAYVHGAEIRDGDRIVKGLVHRDISLCNIMLDVAGRLKITDLGIAKALKDGQVASATDTAWGKLAYAPAEQLAGRELDGSADLYALAITLFILLAGKHPYDDPAFPNEHPLNRASRAARNERKPIRELLPEAPVALADILEGLLQPLETRTPRRADELVERFHDIIKSLGSDLYRLERQAGALVSRVWIDDSKDLTEMQPLPAVAAASTDVPEASHERPVARPQAAEVPPPRTLPLTGAEPTPPTVRLAPAGAPSPSRAMLLALIGAASLVLAVLVVVAAVVFVPLVTRPTGGIASRDERPEPRATGTSTGGFAGEAPGTAHPESAGTESTRESVAPASPGAVAARAGEPPEDANADAPTEEPAGEAARPAEHASSEAGPSDAAPAARGRLRVYILPFGDVRVDGRLIAPRQWHELPAGRHRLVATSGSRRQVREVELEPGEREQVVFRF